MCEILKLKYFNSVVKYDKIERKKKRLDLLYQSVMLYKYIIYINNSKTCMI